MCCRNGINGRWAPEGSYFMSFVKDNYLSQGGLRIINTSARDMKMLTDICSPAPKMLMQRRKCVGSSGMKLFLVCPPPPVMQRGW